MSVRTLIAATGLVMLTVAASSPSFANQTGNESNVPAVIQRMVGPQAPVAPSQMQRSAAVRRPVEAHKACAFLGSEAGNRNPDYVQCYN